MAAAGGCSLGVHDSLDWGCNPMSFPAGSLKFRLRRRTPGVSGHRVVVRRHLPWYWYVLGVALAFFLVIELFSATQQRGGEGQQELESLRRKVRQLDDELLSLRSIAGTERSAVQMERSTAQQLINQVKVLESENAALKEDLLLFERLLQSTGGEASVRVEGVKVLPDGPRRFRYRILLAYQPGRRAPVFHGQLQLAVAFLAEGKSKELMVPAGKQGAGGLDVEVRGFLRKEGWFELPLGASLQSVEARVFQGDTLKTKRHEQL